MKTTLIRSAKFSLLLAMLFGCLPMFAAAAEEKSLPTLYLIGDSTVKNGTKGLQGWGDPIAAYFDKTKINVQNRARGGRSSRTYRTEGLWDAVLKDIKPGDFVMMQFGHNDGGPLDKEKSRGSIRGNGDETKEVAVPDSDKKETVHSYGWYLRQFAKEAKAKGATPIVLSLIPRNDWKNDHVLRASEGYGAWAAAAAKAEDVSFIDLNGIVADKYDKLGQEKVKEFFPKEHTHTSVSGAELNASAVVEGVKSLKDCPLKDYLLPNGPQMTEMKTEKKAEK